MEPEKNSIDETTVRHMATLSRLYLSDEEISLYTEQLSEILNYASQLPSVDASVDEVSLSLRTQADTSLSTHHPHELLRNAAELENGYVKVPAILDKGES